MVKRGARQHQSIHQGHRDTDGHAFAERAQHAAGRAAVQINSVAGAAVVRGDDEGLAFHAKADVADETRVENAVHRFAVVLAALRQTLDLGAFGGSEFAHSSILVPRRVFGRANLDGFFAPKEDADGCKKNGVVSNHSKLVPLGPAMSVTPPRSLVIVILFLVGLAALACSDTVKPPGVPEVQVPFASLKPSATIPIGQTADWVGIGTDSVWVAATKPFQLVRISPASNQVVARVDLPGEACSGLEIAFDTAWIPLCTQKPSIVRVDLVTNKITATLDVGCAAAEGGIAASPDSVWVVTNERGTLARIDPKTNLVRQRISLPPGSLNPIFSHGMIWISSPYTDGLTAVNAVTGVIIANISVGKKPRFLTAGDGSIWTVNQGDGTVTRVDENTRRVVATIRAGVPGDGVDISYGGGAIWVTHFDLPLTQIDTTLNRAIHQWIGPGGDAVRFGHGSIWLTDYHHGLLWRFPADQIPK